MLKVVTGHFLFNCQVTTLVSFIRDFDTKSRPSEAPSVVCTVVLMLMHDGGRSMNRWRWMTSDVLKVSYYDYDMTSISRIRSGREDQRKM